ncbi:MAG: hypothetical protein WCP73_06625 [Eubacteriales bacterium]
MWGLFVGIGLGFMQMLLLRKTVSLMLGSSTSGPLVAVLITVLKLAAIMGILLWLAFGAGLEPMLWAAGAMCVIMIALPVYFNIKKAKKPKQEGDK